MTRFQSFLLGGFVGSFMQPLIIAALRAFGVLDQ